MTYWDWCIIKLVSYNVVSVYYWNGFKWNYCCSSHNRLCQNVSAVVKKIVYVRLLIYFTMKHASLEQFRANQTHNILWAFTWFCSSCASCREETKQIGWTSGNCKDFPHCHKYYIYLLTNLPAVRFSYVLGTIR